MSHWLLRFSTISRNRAWKKLLKLTCSWLATSQYDQQRTLAMHSKVWRHPERSCFPLEIISVVLNQKACHMLVRSFGSTPISSKTCLKVSWQRVHLNHWWSYLQWLGDRDLPNRNPSNDHCIYIYICIYSYIYMAYNTHISIGCLSETNVVSCSCIGLLPGSKIVREVVGPSPYGAVHQPTKY